MRAADVLLASAGDLTTLGVALLMAIAGSLYIALMIRGLAAVLPRE